MNFLFWSVDFHNQKSTQKNHCKLTQTIVKLLLILIFIYSKYGWCSSVTIENDVIKINGEITKSLANEVAIQLSAHPKIETINFNHSLGGTKTGLYELVNIIKRRKINTNITNQCNSACAFAFLAGKTRTLSGGLISPTKLGIHLARTTDDKEAPDNDALLQYLVELTDNKLREPFRSLIRKSWKADSALLFLHWGNFLTTKTKAIYCPGDQGANLSKCQDLGEVDLYELGILTPP